MGRNDGVSHALLFAFSCFYDGVCAKSTQLQSDVSPGQRRSAGVRPVPSGLRRASLRQVSSAFILEKKEQTAGFDVYRNSVARVLLSTSSLKNMLQTPPPFNSIHLSREPSSSSGS